MESRVFLGIVLLFLGFLLLYILRSELVQVIFLVLGVVGVILAFALIVGGLGLIFVPRRRW